LIKVCGNLTDFTTKVDQIKHSHTILSIITTPFPAILGCQIAARNLMDNADGKSIVEGYNYYVMIHITNCEEKLFGGYKITMKFTCR